MVFAPATIALEAASVRPAVCNCTRPVRGAVAKVALAGTVSWTVATSNSPVCALAGNVPVMATRPESGAIVQLKPPDVLGSWKGAVPLTQPASERSPGG
eukprot:4379605-Pyramimonas_sp.AAC.1